MIRFTGTREELRKLLYSFVASLSGRSGDYEPYVRGIKLRVGMVALACVQEAFAVKADGGTGDDGIKWKPLSPATIAQRPISLSGILNDKALLRSHGIKPYGKHERGLLTPAQNKRWKMIFATRKAWLMAKHGMGDGAAAARAASIAWATLKSEGAKTKLEVLGGRHVQIGRDTGRLFASLSPGTREPERHRLMEQPPPIEFPATETQEDDRVLHEDIGSVTVGTNVEYAEKFHADRPLWPIGDLPSPWSKRIESAARTGVMEAITMILEGHG